jgi:hypothetical protein
MLAPLVAMGGTGNLPVHPLLRGSPALDAASDNDRLEQQRDSWIELVDPPNAPPWILFDRVVDGDGDGVAVRDLGAYEVNDVWQTELLVVQAKGPAPHAVVTTPGGYDRGAGTSYDATDANGQFVTYLVPVAETGNYAISVRVRQAGDAGRFQASVADDPAGPWTNLGPVQETYAASAGFAERSLAASHAFATTGGKLLRFTVAGKDAASAGYRLFLDSVKLARLP